jgi:hypothetical protein
LAIEQAPPIQVPVSKLGLKVSYHLLDSYVILLDAKTLPPLSLFHTMLLYPIG